jgi:hypothetical protein
MTTILLRVLPVVLVIIYVLEYTYAFRFLLRFSVTPEEVGISEIELLSRAALLTLFALTLYGLILTGAVIIFALVSARGKQVDARNWNIIEDVRRTSRRRKLIRVISTVLAVFTIALVIVTISYIGPASDMVDTIIYAVFGAVIVGILYYTWENKTTRYMSFASGATLGIFLLSAAVFGGGYALGGNASTTGQIPEFVNATGVDILQVHPSWINKQIAPPGYEQDQDMLELGSSIETVYLYDCATRETYGIPLNDVVLTYTIYKQSPADIKRLRCSPGPNG